MVRRKRSKSSKHPQPVIERTTFQPYTVILAIANLLLYRLVSCQCADRQRALVVESKGLTSTTRGSENGDWYTPH